MAGWAVGSATKSQRGQHNVQDLAIVLLPAEDAVATSDLCDALRGPGEERPAGQVATKPASILAQHLGRVVVRVDGHRDEGDVPAESGAEVFLDLDHLVGRRRTHIRAAREDEVERDDLAAQRGRGELSAVLRGQREVERRPDPRKPFGLARRMQAMRARRSGRERQGCC
jgi:hypothetical protein